MDKIENSLAKNKNDNSEQSTLDSVPTIVLDPSDPEINLVIGQCRKRITTGFSNLAKEGLLKIVNDDRFGKGLRFDALYTLSKWYAAMGDPALAVEFGKQANMLRPWFKSDFNFRLYLSWCFASVGDGRNAEKVLPKYPLRRSRRPLLDMAKANAIYALGQPINERHRLNKINRVFRRAGLSEIELIDSSGPLNMSNFGVRRVKTKVAHELVSILVPAYNCTASLHHAMDSLLNQTWANIEIIVADDASTDGTADIVARYMERDSRVRYVRLEKNQGAYVARNAALALARGDFVTTHDTDDWSHPQKIELQVTQLIADRKLAYTCSSWARMDENFFFTGKTENKGLLVHENVSSYMYRRQYVISLGGWDPVRISADSELARRIAATYRARVKKVCALAPLSFAITPQDSLTRSGPTHGRTISHGVRRSYKESSSFWLERNKTRFSLAQGSPSLRIENSTGARSFPVPSLILPDRKSHETYDLMIVARSIAGHKSTNDLISFLKTHRSVLGFVGVLTWADFWDDPSASPHPDLRQMAQDGHIHFISPGVAVQTRRLLIWDAWPLKNLMDMAPTLTQHSSAANAYIRTAESLNLATRAQVEETIKVAFHLPSIWLTTENEFLKLPRGDEEARMM